MKAFLVAMFIVFLCFTAYVRYLESITVFHPSHELLATPRQRGLDFENVTLTCTINNATHLSIFTKNSNTPFLKKLYDYRMIQTSEKPVDIKILQWEEFISRINGGKEKYSSLADVVRTTAIAEECYTKRKSLELS